MKREFLENFKVGGAPLSKEIIDAILSENEKDVADAKKPFADYDSIKDQLNTAKEALKKFDETDVDGLNKQIKDLQDTLKNKETEYETRLADLTFDGILKDAITAAKGRSTKAIMAMLDVDSLKLSKNQATDIKSALEALKKESGYLFEDEKNPPPFSAGTGTGSGGGSQSDIDKMRAAAGLSTEKK